MRTGSRGAADALTATAGTLPVAFKLAPQAATVAKLAMTQNLRLIEPVCQMGLNQLPMKNKRHAIEFDDDAVAILGI